MSEDWKDEGRYQYNKNEKISFDDMMAREQELIHRRQELFLREEELERRAAQQKELLEQKEREVYSSMEKRALYLNEREKQLAERHERAELEFHEEMSKAQDANFRLRQDLIQMQVDLNESLREAEAEKQRYTEEGRSSIQGSSQKFVTSALTTLGAKENKFHSIAKTWAAIGAVSLVAGVIFAIVTMIYSADSYHQAGDKGLGYYLYSLFRGLVVVGVFGLLSRYAFVFSNSYMHESLKVGERVHAIKFGEFYLDTYGVDAKWEQVKDAFAQWNISGQSAFSKQDGAIDFSATGPIVQAAEKAIDAAAKLIKKE